MDKYYIFVILGIAIIIFDVFALIIKRKKFGKKVSLIKGKGFRYLFELSCIIIGAKAAYTYWNYDNTTKIFGFPFPAAVFQLENGKWYDYVGPFSIPLLFINFLIIYYLPHAFLNIYSCRKIAEQDEQTIKQNL